MPSSGGFCFAVAVVVLTGCASAAVGLLERSVAFLKVCLAIDRTKVDLGRRVLCVFVVR